MHLLLQGMLMTLSSQISIDHSDTKTSSNNTSVDNEPEANCASVVTKNTPTENNKLKNITLERELQFMDKQRNKIRLCDPRGVYFYRHVPCGWFASLLNILTLLISSTLIFLLLVAVFFIPGALVVDVNGVGSVNDATIINVLELFFIVLIVATAFYSLRRQTRDFSVKRYGLAMLANAFNRVLFSYLKVTIYFGALLMAIIIMKDNDTTLVLDNLSNGIIGDIFEAVASVVSVIIFYRAFSSCHKELSLCD